MVGAEVSEARVARCPKLEAGLRLQRAAPKGRPSKAQANGLGNEAVFVVEP
jgi:hypothetical protein